MAYEARPGDVSIFENEKAGHENAPDYRGYVVAYRDIKAGEKVAIVLWTGRPNSARTFSGQIGDISRKEAEPTPTDLFGNPL